MASTSFTPFIGYPGLLWNVVYTSLQWLQQQLAANPTPPEGAAAASVVYNTLHNALDAIGAYQTLNAWQWEQQNLNELSGLTLGLNPQDQAFLTARVGTFSAAIPALQAIIPSTPFPYAPPLLAAGKTPIPYFGFLEFYMDFSYETAPSGLTNANLALELSNLVTAWQDIASAAAGAQGAALTQAYDVAVRMRNVSLFLYNMNNDLASGLTVPSGSVTLGQVWNYLVAAPSMAQDASLYYSAPFSLENQQGSILRFIILNTLKQLDLYLLSLSRPQFGNIAVAQVYSNDTLMDFAARNLGDFEDWQSVAALNGLAPPWVGPSSDTPYGATLLLPTSTTSPPTSGLPVPSYADNVLGIDLYLGPINQPMLPWTGDFQLISGYQNYSQALGRRLQTPIGSLIYHTTYGSRIPPQAGAIQTPRTVTLISAFAESAIMSDPRTAQVISATGQLLPNGFVSFSGVVQPVGIGAVPASVNETIGPLP